MRDDGCHPTSRIHFPQPHPGNSQSSSFDLPHAKDKIPRVQTRPAAKALLGVRFFRHSPFFIAELDSLKDNATAIEEACRLDLGKGIFEANLTELDFSNNNIIYNINHLKEWVKDEKAPDVPLDMKVLRPKIRKDPLGTVLIIGSVALQISLTLQDKGHASDAE